MIIKKCKVCLIEKDIINFQIRKTKKGSIYHRAECNSCNSIRNKKYYIDNKIAISENGKNYRDNNPQLIKSRKKEYYIKNKEKLTLKTKKYLFNNKESIRQQKREYNKINKEKINKQKLNYTKNKEKTNLSFKLRNRVSCLVYNHLRRNFSSKHGKSFIKFLPYTINDLKIYIESLFESWMNWNNWGRYDPQNWNDNDHSTWTWQIDHIIPHSTFKYTSTEDQAFKDCWDLENLRPYSAKQNNMDGARLLNN